MALGLVLSGQEDTTNTLSELKKEVTVEAKTLYSHVDKAWKSWSGDERRSILNHHKLWIVKTQYEEWYSIILDKNVYDYYLKKDGEYSFEKPDISDMSEEESIKEARKIMKKTQEVLLKVMEEEQLASKQENQ